MGKRLVRIRTTRLAEQASRLVGAELTVVLADGRSVLGQLLRFENDEFHLRDKIGRPHRLPLAAVNELILDEKTMW